MMNRVTLRPSSPAGPGGIAPARVSRCELLLEPPGLDVPLAGEGECLEVLQRLLGEPDGVARVEERVRRVLVQRLVERVVRGLARRLAAVGAVPGVCEGLFGRPVALADVVELTLALPAL